MGINQNNISSDETYENLISELRQSYEKIKIINRLMHSENESDELYYEMIREVFPIELKADIKTDFYRYVGPDTKQLCINVLPLEDITKDMEYKETFSVDEIIKASKEGKLLINTSYFMNTDVSVKNDDDIIDRLDEVISKLSENLCDRETIHKEEAKRIRLIFNSLWLSVREKELNDRISEILTELSSFSEGQNKLGLVK